MSFVQTASANADLRRRGLKKVGNFGAGTPAVKDIELGEYLDTVRGICKSFPDVAQELLLALNLNGSNYKVVLDAGEIGRAKAALTAAFDNDNGHELTLDVKVLEKRIRTAAAARPKPSAPNCDPERNLTMEEEPLSGAERTGLPWFPSGSPASCIFRVLDEAQSCIAAEVVAGVLVTTVLLSTVAIIMESHPQFRERPAECWERINSGLGVSAEVCEPRPLPAFDIIEAVCSIVFTIDYVLRLSTAHVMAPEDEHGLYYTLKYALRPMNIFDFISILPFYLEMILTKELSHGWKSLMRLVRILRLFRMGNYNPGMAMVAKVLVLSGQPLLLLLCFNLVIVVVFGSLIFFIEGQHFSVDASFTAPHVDACNRTVSPSHPFGLYVRESTGGAEYEATPFRSILHGIWWVSVTMTTVGYGDYTPNSYLGRALGVLTFYTGILFLALPIGVISTTFDSVYNDFLRSKHINIEKKKPYRSTTGMKRVLLEHAGTPLPVFPSINGILPKIFMMAEEPAASKIGTVYSLSVNITIVTSTVLFIMESVPSNNVTPDECSSTDLSAASCRPRPHASFAVGEAVCIGIFTFDYVTRLLTVSFVSSEECGLEGGIRGCRKFLLYWWQPLNLIDLAAILPFYCELVFGFGAGVPVLRVFRLIRVFRLLREPKLRACADMFLNVIVDALPAIFNVFIVTVSFCVLFASCLVYAEGSNYSMDTFPDHPEGVYIRPTVDGRDVMISPLTSSLDAFWWFFATATTVGYGDEYPTTWLGRFVAVVAFYTGIVLIALPLTVVGSSFTKYYPDWVQEYRHFAKQQELCSNTVEAWT